MKMNGDAQERALMASRTLLAPRLSGAPADLSTRLVPERACRYFGTVPPQMSRGEKQVILRGRYATLVQAMLEFWIGQTLGRNMNTPMG
jgi:hypothetical protein